ncbi:MAG: GAF domain-containing protein [Candidatus Rokubacteria bacterium]|nr:GAF domain-containing protein [Candidatus Rokubacteria bacterium]
MLARLKLGSLRTKFLGSLLLLSVLPLSALGVFAYRQGEVRLRSQVFENLSTVALLKGKQIEAWVKERQKDVTRPASMSVFQERVITLVEQEGQPRGKEARRGLLEIMERIRTAGELAEMFLLEPNEGRVLISTDPEEEGKFKKDRPYFREGRKGPFVQHVYYSLTLGKPVMTFSAPVVDAQGRLGAILVGRADLRFLDRLMMERSGLGRTGQTFLVNRFNYFVSESLGRGEYGLRPVFSEGAKLALAGQTGTGLYINHENRPVVGGYRWLPEIQLALIAEVDQREALALVRQFGMALLAVLGVVSGGALLLGVGLSCGITRPVSRLVEAARAIGKGDLTHQVEVKRPEELAVLASAVNQMADDLLRSRRELESYSQTLEVRVEERTRESESRRRAAEALAEVGRGVSQSLDPGVVAQRIADSVRALLRAQSSALYRVEHDSGNMVTLAASGDAAAAFGRKPVFPRGTGLVALAVRARHPVVTPNLLSDPRVILTPEWRARIEQATFRAALCVPLVAKDTVIGALGVGDREGRVFGKEEVRLAQAFADQAAMALENAQLYQETQERLNRTETLLAVSQAIGSTLDLTETMRRVARETARALGADMVGAYLADPDRAHVRPIAGYHVPKRLIEAFTAFPIPLKGHRFLEEAWEHQKPIFSGDPETDPRIDRETLERFPPRSVLFVPMIVKGEVFGGLFVIWWERRHLPASEELRLVEGIGRQAATALENARLYRQAEERAEKLKAFSALTRLITSAPDSRRVVSSVVNAATGLLGARMARAWVDDPVAHVLRSQESIGIDPKLEEALTDVSSIPHQQGVVGAVFESRTPEYIQDIQQDPRWINQRLAKEAHLHAYAGLPMITGDRVVGVLSILFSERRQFTTEEKELMNLLADQAAISIERSRLFEELKGSIEELQRTQDQLAQAQKMEAVGRLAGGVAHDFNNLLTIIMGRTQLLSGRLPVEDPLRRDIELIDKAGKRAAALTQQLLAFSRKQVLQPKVLDLNAVVANMETMLRRLIGEDIELVTVRHSDLGCVKADPARLEQVILNLAVNARDAMPRGGKLTIETADVELDETYAFRHGAVHAGPYVMLAISDTGCGMDAKTQSHIFEPFFTTKEKGRGTGLGLSTVYGIVKQSGGYIWVYSEPGRGSTFKIYLPRIEQPAETVEPDPRPAGPFQGSETILLVEDESELRELACEILGGTGYTVLAATDGVEALRVSQAHPGPIHLLVTDVVMPKMSGRELADRLAPIRPAIKTLYMSGYTDDAIVHHGVLDPGVFLIEKPFTPDALLGRIREVLDEPQNCLA